MQLFCHKMLSIYIDEKNHQKYFIMEEMKMLNLLIANKNLQKLQDLQNYISQYLPEIRVGHIATNGKEVLNALNKNHFDIVLMDNNLPGYDGFDILQKFISSNIHEYRQFAIFTLTYILNDTNIKEIFDFVNKNIEYINNWDLTDIAGPNLFAKYLYTLDEKIAKKKILEYMSSDKLWTKRIGIVILLEYARKGKINFVLDNISKVLYEDYHLYQKASGWVLREAYKKDNKKVFEYLFTKNKERKLPRILLSYACEKMSIEEKKKIRSV